MSTGASTEGLPLDDRSNDLKIPIITLITFSSIFVGLRLYVSLKNRNFFQLTDHFLWTGHVSSTSSLLSLALHILTNNLASSSCRRRLCVQNS